MSDCFNIVYVVADEGERSIRIKALMEFPGVNITVVCPTKAYANTLRGLSLDKVIFCGVELDDISDEFITSLRINRAVSRYRKIDNG